MKSKGDSIIELNQWRLTRREFLKTTAGAATGLILLPESYNRADQDVRSVTLSFGVVTDSHYADIETSGTRYYRESIGKMTECVQLMNDREVNFLIHLGDFINGAESETMDNLRQLESVYAQFNGPRYHLLGNHDTDSLSKTDFLSVIDNTGIDPARTWYSFDRGGLHFVVLDADFNEDGTAYEQGNFVWTDANVPQDQLDWLEEDLNRTSDPTVVFIHQLLDFDEGSHYVRNAGQVRGILESHSHVRAVFQGHQHNGQYNVINGIHYYTLKAMVENSGEENNSYAVVDVLDDLTLVVSGYRKAVGLEMS